MVIALAFATSLPGVPSNGAATRVLVAETLTPSTTPDYLETKIEASIVRRNDLFEKPPRAEENKTTSAQQQKTRFNVGATARHAASVPVALGSPQPLKRKLEAKRTNGADKSTLRDLCEANRGEWCSSWSADAYSSDPCRDKWAGVHCDSSQSRVTGL
jgi:hypothetical protein